MTDLEKIELALRRLAERLRNYDDPEHSQLLERIADQIAIDEIERRKEHAD